MKSLKKPSSGTRRPPPLDEAVLCRLFCLLARYAGACGATKGGGADQAACPDAALRAMRSAFGVDFECFASPFNARLTGFCSAFPDVDAHFGATGDFFSDDFEPRDGAFEVNPPFTVGIVRALADKLEALLDAAAAADAALEFIVVLPAWDEDAGDSEASLARRRIWERLRKMRHCRHVEKLPAKDHAFTLGMQHCSGRPKPALSGEDGEAWTAEHRTAGMATSLVFLRTAAAEQSNPVTEGKLAKIREGFRVAPPGKSADAGDVEPTAPSSKSRLVPGAQQSAKRSKPKKNVEPRLKAKLGKNPSPNPTPKRKAHSNPSENPKRKKAKHKGKKKTRRP